MDLLNLRAQDVGYSDSPACGDWYEGSHHARHIQKSSVVYPGLTSTLNTPSQKQVGSGGALITATLAGGLDASQPSQVGQLFALAESLGGVESLIEHPAIMTHASVPRRPGGIGDRRWTGRFSCGIEEAEDLLEDVDHALGKIS